RATHVTSDILTIAALLAMEFRRRKLLGATTRSYGASRHFAKSQRGFGESKAKVIYRGGSYWVKPWIGTSGFQYAEWKGTFYPEDLPAAKMLAFYAEHLATTEINYTFHRIPAAKTIENWKHLTPENFRFALKAPQKITHWSKLRDCADTMRYFYDVVKISHRIGAITQLRPMCDLLRGFERKPEVLRRQVLPILDCFRGGDAMERVINLCGGKMFRIKCQHLRRRQIFRIKSSFPFGVLKAGSANPRLHPIASSTVNNLSFAFTKTPLTFREMP